MRFIETSVFTKEVRGLLADSDYRALQLALVLRAEQGALMRGSGGLRKIRTPAQLRHLRRIVREEFK